MLTSFIARHVAPLLHAHGFHRSGLVWNRIQPGVIHVIDVQRGTQISLQEVDFTINVGVLLDSLWHIVEHRSLPRVVRELDCFPRLRVGQLLGSGWPSKDVWWTLTTSCDLDALGATVRDVLEIKCTPFLDTLTSISSVLAVAEDPVLRRLPIDRLSYAVLKHLAGRREEANQLLTEMLGDPNLRYWHERIHDISGRLAGMA
jgi:hypothetical protein